MRHDSSKAVGTLEAQSAVRVDAVVEAPPFLDHHPGLCHAEEHLLVEALIAQPVVEALGRTVTWRASTTSSGGSAWGERCSTPSANAGWSSKTGVGSSMKFARIAASGCVRPRSSQPSCHPGSEGPSRILPTAQPMLDIEPDLLTLSGPQTGSRST